MGFIYIKYKIFRYIWMLLVGGKHNIVLFLNRVLLTEPLDCVNSIQSVSNSLQLAMTGPQNTEQRKQEITVFPTRHC